MTRPLTLVLTVSTAAVLSATQARPADEVTRVVFAVNDRGEPVTDLRPEEFSAVTTTTTLQLVNLQSAGVAAASDGRMVGVVIDDLHVLPAETPLLRETLRVIRDQFLEPADIVSAVSTGLPPQQLDFRREPDRGRLTTAIERTMGSASAIVPRRVSRTALMTLNNFVANAGSGPTRVKAVLLVSPGYVVADLFTPNADPDGDLVGDVARVVRTAANTATVIYTINPRGTRRMPPPDWPSTPEAWQRTSQASLTSMRILSGATGGTCICDTANIPRALASIDADMASHYVLTLRSPNMSPIQNEIVRISTTRPGVTLRYAQQR